MLEIDLELPQHEEELKKVDEKINEYKKKLQKIKESKILPPNEFNELYEKVITILYYVGGLSESAFAVESLIESTYFNVHRDQPELARNLWQEHYGSIHQPYNVRKNRLFKLLEQLDDLYIKINKCFPPNYNE